MRGDDLPTRNFTSYNAALGEAFDEGILGFIGADIRFGGDWDAGLNAVDITAPPGLFPRDDLALLDFFTSGLDAITPWSFPYARLRSATNGGEVSNKVTFQCSGHCQGPFGYPEGDS